jgi:hypothetical protein
VEISPEEATKIVVEWDKLYRNVLQMWTWNKDTVNTLFEDLNKKPSDTTENTEKKGLLTKFKDLFHNGS